MEPERSLSGSIRGCAWMVAHAVNAFLRKNSCISIERNEYFVKQLSQGYTKYVFMLKKILSASTIGNI